MYGREEKELSGKIINDVFISKLAYLLDLLGEIYTLKISLQEHMTNILTAQEKVARFLRKLQLYQSRAELENVSMLSELKERCFFVDIC